MDTSMQLLAGAWPVQTRRLPPFSPLALAFLEALRQELLKSRDETQTALAFWLRPKHIAAFQQTLPDWETRLGRGLIFHIAPANIPGLFAYSFALSLLAGNSNIIRLSPRTLDTGLPICQRLRNVLARPEFSLLNESTAFITYERNKELTDDLSAQCQGRIIWGGDGTIAAIRESPLPVRAVELAFADRFSIAILAASTLEHASDEEIALYAHHFYNDTYSMDQKACSSPTLILWLPPEPGHSLEAVQRRWWQTVAATAKAYELAPIKVSQKYTRLWQTAVNQPGLAHIDRYTNILYVYTLSALPADVSTLTGGFGQFFQYNLTELASCLPYVNEKLQTISTIGIDAAKLRRLIISHGCPGGDRIVPLGQALDLRPIWDGINVLATLSRLID